MKIGNEAEYRWEGHLRISVLIIHLGVESAEFAAGEAQRPAQRPLVCQALTWRLRDRSDTRGGAHEPSLATGDPQDITQGS